MANILYANNAAGTLNAPITAASTSMTLNAGQIAAFPSPTPPQVFYVTLTDAATQTLIEIVQVTAVSGNIMSIVRAQDGTSALSWNANDIVSQRAIRLEMNGWENAAEGNFAAQGVAVTPSTTLGIVGTTSANNANPGSVGEYLSTTSGTAPLTSGTPESVGTINLTAGDWDVQATTTFLTSGVSAMNVVLVSLSPTLNVVNSQLGSTTVLQASLTPATQTISTPVFRINISALTAWFATVQANYSAGSVSATTLLVARRAR
jgi:hypothetical protein